MLRNFGILAGEVETRASMGLPDAVILDGRDPAGYIPAPESGLFETMVDPGDEVFAGQTVGRIHFIERPERRPEPIVSPLAAFAACVRAISNTSQGDVVVVLGRPISREALA